MGALEARLGLVPVVGVGLDMRAWNTSSAEVLLSFSHLAASKEESVRAYYNFYIRI